MNEQEKKEIIEALRPFAYAAGNFEDAQGNLIIASIHPPPNDIELPLDVLRVKHLRAARDLFLKLVNPSDV